MLAPCSAEPESHSNASKSPYGYIIISGFPCITLNTNMHMIHLFVLKLLPVQPPAASGSWGCHGCNFKTLFPHELKTGSGASLAATSTRFQKIKAIRVHLIDRASQVRMSAGLGFPSDCFVNCT